MTLDVTWIALGLFALVSTIALIMAISLKSRILRQEESAGARIDKLENELSALLDGNFGMGRQLHELQRDLKDTREKQQQLEQRDLGALPYNQAVRLVATGATVDQLVDQCGLSRSEADLIMLLHKSSPPVVEPLQGAVHEGDAEPDRGLDLPPNKLDEDNRQFMDETGQIDDLAEEEGISALDGIEDIDEPIETQSEVVSSSIERANQPKGE